MITFGLKIHARICSPVNLQSPCPQRSSKALSFKGLGCLTIPACTTAPINWIRCRDVRFSHLLLRKTKGRWGSVHTSVAGRGINEGSLLSSTIHFPSAFPTTTCPETECRRRTDRWDFMDILCVITHRQRCTRSTPPASARPLRRLHPENPSPSTLFWPRRRTRAPAGPARLSAQTNTTRGPRLCRSLGTPAYPSQQLRQRQRLTCTHRPCCTQPATCNLDILSTAAHLSATSRHVEARFTHKVKPQFQRVTDLIVYRYAVCVGLNISCLCFCSFRVQSQRRNAFFQNQRREVETDTHQLHQRAAVSAGEGVRPAAVHGRFREVPAGLGSAAHRSSGKKKHQKPNRTYRSSESTDLCVWCCVVSDVVVLCSGQSLVPKQTHQVAQTESGAAAGQTGQTGPGGPAQESRLSRPRRRGVLRPGRGY